MILIVKQSKWKRTGSFWYATEYKGRMVELRWFKGRIAVSIDEGEWVRLYGGLKLWEAKSKALVIVENFIDRSVK